MGTSNGIYTWWLMAKLVFTKLMPVEKASKLLPWVRVRLLGKWLFLAVG